MSDDFWEDAQMMFVGRESTMDKLLDPIPTEGTPFEGEHYTSVRELTDIERRRKALPLPVDAGKRVAFVTNLGSVLTYPDVPDEGVEGTVVTVRTAGGDRTSLDERVFVLWDDGQFRSILAEHLRPAKSSRKQANAVRIVTADLGDLSSFFQPAGGLVGTKSDDLVHKATQDLWSFRQEGGQFVIERLFNEDGNPLKV
jgi:hypothetical protein